MRGLVVAASLCAVVLFALVMRWPGQEGQAPPSGEAVASPPGDTTRPAVRSAYADPAEREARFRAQVLEELERSGAAPPERRPARYASASDRTEAPQEVGFAPHPVAGAEVRIPGSPRPPEEVLTPEERASANWDYLEDVYAGRVSGIPSEQRAGVSLRQMDQMGTIPYVETLREELRIDELEALGLVDPATEPPQHPWPVCVRTGTCEEGDAL